MTITIEQLDSLKATAKLEDDGRMVTICDRAIMGFTEPIRWCEQKLREMKVAEAK